MLKRTDSVAMDLGDILSKAQIITDLRATNRWEAIDELINNLVATGKITPGTPRGHRGRGQEARVVHEHRHRVWHRHPARLDRPD